MDDAALVRRFEGERNLSGNRQRVGERQRPLSDPIGERRAFDQLQHERVCRRAAKFRRRCVLDAVDRGDVRMIQRSERLRLAPGAPADRHRWRTRPAGP